MSTKKFTEQNFLDRLNFAVQKNLNGNWAELARLSDLRPSTIHQIKTGAEPKLSSLERISEALNVSLDWLVKGEGEMYKEAKNAEFLNPQDQAIIELLLALRPEQRKEISAVLEEKKRVNQLEETVNQLQKKVG